LWLCPSSLSFYSLFSQFSPPPTPRWKSPFVFWLSVLSEFWLLNGHVIIYLYSRKKCDLFNLSGVFSYKDYATMNSGPCFMLKEFQVNHIKKLLHSKIKTVSTIRLIRLEVSEFQWLIKSIQNWSILTQDAAIRTISRVVIFF
jgi:hypothetical protein